MERDKSNRTITFITPTLDRKGSEIALINLLQQINPAFQVKLIAKYKGVLFDSILPLIKKIFLFNGKPNRTYFSRIKARLEIRKNISSVLSKERKSVFYINTIVLPDILAYAEKKGISSIVHIHELEQMYVQLNDKQIKRLVSYPELIIANSQASAKVIENYGRKKFLEICYPSLETRKIKPDEKKYIEYRNKLNINSNEFLWVMSGSLDKNKNPFLFIEIAVEMLKRKPNTRFLWIGGTTDKEFEMECLNRATANSVSDKIIWSGDVGEDYYSYFNCADGFVLTSVKESFSMVTVEALLYGLPVVTQNCGGVSEILGMDIGKIVDSKNNSVLMANEMIKFMEGTYKVDKEKQKIRAKEFDAEKVGKHWNEILERYFNRT